MIKFGRDKGPLLLLEEKTILKTFFIIYGVFLPENVDFDLSVKLSVWLTQLQNFL